MKKEYNQFVFQAIKNARDLALFLQDETNFDKDGKFDQNLTFEGLIDSSHIRVISLEMMKDQKEEKTYKGTKIGCFAISYLKEMIELFDGLGADVVDIILIKHHEGNPIVFEANTNPKLYYTLASRVEDDDE